MGALNDGIQTAIMQMTIDPSAGKLPVRISSQCPVPTDLPSAHHVLIRVTAVGLNPTDWKMVKHFPMDGNTVGCDFCGIVESAGTDARWGSGTKVCGAEFPYRPENPHNGAFAEFLTADSRHLLRPPPDMEDTQAAAIGAIGWGTAALAISDPEALGLQGLPSAPAHKALPVLVYGGATATGLMAIQMLRLSGYLPIAVCSDKSAPLVMTCGAIGTASYTSSECVEVVKSIAGGVPIKHVLDCITDAQSAALCFESISRAGGRYACLENFPEAWHTRKVVKVKVVMGFEGQGYDVDLGDSIYSRKANWKLHSVAAVWARELQLIIDRNEVKTQPIEQLPPGFEGIVKGLEMLASGVVQGRKLVAEIK